MTERLLGPNGHDFTELAECLRAFADEEVIFVPNPGNAGDALIDFGTYLFFDAIGLRYRFGSWDESYPGRVVLFSGGGALVDVYPGSDRFIRRVHKDCKAFVLLPHSVRAYPDLLAEMDERCILFAREAPTDAYLRAQCTRAQIRRCHDLAFFASDSDIAAEPWYPRDLPAELRLPWARMAVKFAIHAKMRSSTLHIIRADSEKTDRPVPRWNYDLSALFAQNDMRRPACANSVKMIRQVMRLFDEIESNRLHMAVLGAIIGKPVRMLDNSYGKNSAIHAESIRDYFPNVAFVRN